MIKFDFTNYTEFVADYSSKNGQLVDEFVLNLSWQQFTKLESC